MISPQFNRFYHAFLHDIYEQTVASKRLIISFEKFKEALKHISEVYPRYDGTDVPVSTKEIRTPDLLAHIEWVAAWAAGYGIYSSIFEKEWEEAKQEAYN